MSRIACGMLAILMGLSYWAVRDFVIAQEPSGETIVVSNLTLNYVLFALLIGALVPSVTRKLFPGRFKLMLVPVALAMGMFLVLLLRTLGVEMRF